MADLSDRPERAAAPAAEAQSLVDAMRSGSRVALARSITIVESNTAEDRHLAETLLDLCVPLAGSSIRVGFSGVPGAGKSTLIEKVGVRLVDRGHRVAVLAIDPSSGRTGGSVLGDKTRMEDLSRSPDAFVRPSPSRGSLGGVAPHTRETITLCEAAGYDVIVVETVGTGQSEADVAHLTDFVFLLTVTGAGDDLQGIKRGVIEYADAVLVTKADSGNEAAAEAAARTLQGALSLFRDRESGWTPPILAVSAVHGRGVDELWSLVEEYHSLTSENGYLKANRGRQHSYWLRSSLIREIQDRITTDATIGAGLSDLEEAVRRGELSARSAANTILRSFLDRDGPKDG